MPRLLRSVAAAVLLAFLALAAGTSPGRTAEGPPAPREAATAAGPLAAAARAVVGFQREANRRIGEEMRAVRDGRATGGLLGAVLLAFAYGALHALGPGHGKVVVTGYFFAREARIGRGLLMGAQIALAHTASAVVIVAFADLLLRRTFGGVPAEIPAVRAASYGLIVLIGGLMLARALRAARNEPAGRDHDHHHGQACGCGLATPARRGEGGLLSLGVGLVPCTGSVLILLYTLANDILWAGLLLVAKVAAGMAVTMGALGLASVLARRLLASRLAGAGGARALAAVDVAGAALVTAVGLFLLATATV